MGSWHFVGSTLIKILSYGTIKLETSHKKESQDPRAWSHVKGKAIPSNLVIES